MQTIGRRNPSVYFLILNLIIFSNSRHQNQPPQQNFHLNWSSKSQDLLHKWCDRSSPCDRPRTYDKFYHKLPGNFIDPSNSTTKSLCSSDADEPNNASSEAADNANVGSARKKKRRKKSDRKYSRYESILKYKKFHI